MSKLVWLSFGAFFIALFEILSFAGIRLPDSVALPFFLTFTLVFGYQTLWHGLKALLSLDFRSINALMFIAVSGAFYLKEYPEGAIVIILFTLAEKLEDIGIEKSQSAMDALINKMPKTTQVIGKGLTPIDQVSIGEKILIKPFEMIPLDGVVFSGSSFVDESSITGEPLAQDKSVGDSVFAGTLNKNGALEVQISKVFAESALAKIKEMTFQALQHKSDTQKFIEKFSQYYTPLIITLALFWTFFPWIFLSQPFNQGFSQAIILLVIACPCALVISTPISIFSAIGNASSSGALIKGGKYLELMGKIKAIALDKTRTLTFGELAVTDVIPLGKQTTQEHLLSCAGGIESFSEHPIAKSIVDFALQKNLNLHQIENFESIIGKGAKANCLVCDEKHHCIGKLAFILEEHKVDQKIIDLIEKLQKQGKTVIIVSTHQEVEGLIALKDQIRPDSAELIAKLKSLNIVPVLLTGDHLNAAESVAHQIGIDHVLADLLPEDKAKAVSQLITQYGTTAMFGDGVNDAPALALSHVGISMSSLGSDTALEASSIILLNDRLNLIPFLIRLGKKTLHTIQINTAFALVVKFLFVILALLGFTNLAFAIFADVGVTLLVILYSLRLMHWEESSYSQSL